MFMHHSVDVADSPIDIVLDLPGDDEFRKALEALGIRRGKADRVALESARSPTIAPPDDDGRWAVSDRV